MKTIGRKDKIDFPDLKLLNIDAKIDTGARTSSIHCDEIFTSEKNGKSILHIKLLDNSHPEFKDIIHNFTDFKRKKVKSSSGHSEERYVIETTVTVFNNTFKTEFTLANRKSMNYPVLLGRKFLYKKFIVDISKRNLSYHLKNDQ